MVMLNKYQMFIFNVYHMIKSYGLEYHWFDINENIFYNGVKGLDGSAFRLFQNDPWLFSYANNKIKLAEDILQNGTFTPIFYYEINNRKFVIGGKHRLYSLKLYSAIKKINRKFLFIKLPKNMEEIDFSVSDQKLYYYNGEIQQSLRKPRTANELLFILNDTGDSMSPWLFKNNQIPFTPFNDEELFEKWLAEEEIRYE